MVVVLASGMWCYSRESCVSDNSVFHQINVYVASANRAVNPTLISMHGPINHEHYLQWFPHCMGRLQTEHPMPASRRCVNRTYPSTLIIPINQEHYLQ